MIRLLAEGADDGSLTPPGSREAATSVIFGAVTMTGLDHLVARWSLDAERTADEILGGLGGRRRAPEWPIPAVEA